VHPEVTLDKEEEEVTTEKDPNPLIPNSFEVRRCHDTLYLLHTVMVTIQAGEIC
jgi:hypothetical protein